MTPLPLAELGEALPRSPLLPPPRRRAAGSPSTSPSPCWIKKEETSSPTVRVLNAEVSSVRRSVIGDLDHDEYDSINPVHLNASARDLQGYVDALFSLSVLEEEIYKMFVTKYVNDELLGDVAENEKFLRFTKINLRSHLATRDKGVHLHTLVDRKRKCSRECG